MHRIRVASIFPLAAGLVLVYLGGVQFFHTIRFPNVFQPLGAAMFSACFLVLLSAYPGRGQSDQEIVINEILAGNQSIAPLVDYPTYFPDYVELYNNASTNIDLGAQGWSLSTKKAPSSVDFKDHFRFRTNTVIPPGGHLLVFLDGSTNVPGIHTSYTVGGTNVVFTLKAGGDQVQLFKNFSLVNSNGFGVQVPDFSIGRVPSGSASFVLNRPTPAGTNASAPLGDVSRLRINEWMSLSVTAGVTNSDWFELYNPDTNVVLLSGLYLADASKVRDANLGGGIPAVVPPIASYSYIAPLGFLQFFCVTTPKAADEVGFSLSSTTGDEIHLFNTDGTTAIDAVTTGLLAANVSEGRLPDGGDTITLLSKSTPEASNLQTITNLVINELLAHTDPPLEDAIEFYNPTGSPISIGDYWLSNNSNDPKKYRIAPGTVVPAHGFKVFYEQQFNAAGTGSGTNFTFNSANGDEAWLFSADSSGKLTGFRLGVAFGPSANGVSFGRYQTSDGKSDFVATSAISFGSTNPPSSLNVFRTGTGATNPAPRIGPLVINEIHYHPPDVLSGTNLVDNSADEFIEIFNVSGGTVLLYDPNRYFDNNVQYADGRTNTWRLRGGVDFDFPEGVTLPVNGFLLVVNFDPLTNATTTAAWRDRFTPPISPTVPLYGPYKGKLSNSGASVDLYRPDPPQGPQHPDFRLVPYILTDHIKYSDTLPWPIEADGKTNGVSADGFSLQRISAYVHGNDPINWMARPPTPGRFNTPSGIEAPTIATQPHDLSVAAGKPATFTVSARGGSLAYQWLFNDTVLASPSSAALKLLNVGTNQAGAYHVIITNVAGAVTSAVVQLAVSVTPESVRPTVSITSPAASKLTIPSLTAAGTAKDLVGVKTVRYSVNDSPFLDATGSVTWAVWGMPAPAALVPGTNWVRAYSVDHADNHSLTNQRSYFLSAATPIAISVNGQGVVTGATNQQRLEVGRNFTLTAVPGAGFIFSNWIITTNLTLAGISSPASLTYLMQSNLAVTANFVTNPFLPLAGTFNGLFYDTNQALQSSWGSFKLLLTTRGTYTASLIHEGKTLKALGKFEADGRATNRILRTGTTPLVVEWVMDLAGSDQVLGTVTDGTWRADLIGDRAVFNGTTRLCPAAGKYTFVIPGTPGATVTSEGHGYGTATVGSNGVVTLKGLLGDKTPVAKKLAMSKNGDWPLHVLLYGRKGSVFSWVRFADLATNDLSGEFYWSKPPLPLARYYPAGFVDPLTIQGSRYAAPVGLTNKILSLANAVLQLDGGNLLLSHTNNLTLLPPARITNNSPDRVTMTFTLASGLFKGTFASTSEPRTASFGGAVLQKSTNGFGFFLGTNRSGSVSFQAAP